MKPPDFQDTLLSYDITRKEKAHGSVSTRVPLKLFVYLAVTVITLE